VFKKRFAQFFSASSSFVLVSGVALVVSVVAACGGHVDDGRKHPPDAGVVSHHGVGVSNDASVREPDATTAIPDASTPIAVEAGTDGSADTLPDAARIPDAAPPDANVCSSDGALTIAGDYVAADKTQYWFRKSATATTYTVVPGAGAPSPLPQLFRVTSVCPRRLSLAGTDGSVARLDWVNAADSLRVCVRSSKDSADLEALPLPDMASDATGCAGGPWIALARTTP
jgi:hypothetical protein